jgi:ribosomal protein S27E
MLPLYAARIEDLGRGDFVKIDCAACDHVALLAPDFLLQLGLSPRTKVLDLTGRVRCRGCGARDGPSFRSSGGAGPGEPRLVPAPASVLARLQSPAKP